jgi:hypothetical protein
MMKLPSPSAIQVRTAVGWLKPWSSDWKTSQPSGIFWKGSITWIPSSNSLKAAPSKAPHSPRTKERYQAGRVFFHRVHLGDVVGLQVVGVVGERDVDVADVTVARPLVDEPAVYPVRHPGRADKPELWLMSSSRAP